MTPPTINIQTKFKKSNTVEIGSRFTKKSSNNDAKIEQRRAATVKTSLGFFNKDDISTKAIVDPINFANVLLNRGQKHGSSE